MVESMSQERAFGLPVQGGGIWKPPHLHYDLDLVEMATGQCNCGLSLAERVAFRRWFDGRTFDPSVRCVTDRRLQHFPLEEGYGLFIPSLSRIAAVNPAGWQVLKAFEHGAVPNEVAVHSPWPGQALALAEALYRLGFLTVPGEVTLAAPTAAGKGLTAWLHLTNQCTLDCAYCFIKKSSARMTPETGRRAVERIIESAVRHGYESAFIKYAGGEPTLALDLLIDLHTYAAALAEAAGLPLHGVVLSNGVGLSPAKVARLRAAGLALTISLDGLGAVHDAQRPLVSGAGSAAHVLAGIEAALAGGLPPEITITVTRANTDSLPALIDWLLERDLRFHLNFYQTHAETAAQHRIDQEAIIAAMQDVFAQIEQRLPRFSLLNALVDHADLSVPHQTPCGMGDSYLVFDHDGRLARCQMAITDTVGDVSHPDPLLLIRGAESAIRNTPVDEKRACARCPWRYWCGGGCPLEAYRLTGRTDVKSTNCAIYKALFPAVIRLEGLRLLRYAAAAPV